jgi:hypothetical protein
MVGKRAFAAAIVATCGLATGCSFAPVISDHSIRYNLVAAKSSNQVMLLNVLRAKDRRPMHFTALGLMRGSFSLSATGSLAATIGRNPTAPFGLGAGVSGSSGPSFDVAILNSKKFMSGILTPVRMAQIDYYWQQGWPKEILLHLFVEKIEIKRKDNSTYDICYNSPSNSTELEKFQSKLRQLNLRIASTNPTAYGPAMTKPLPPRVIAKLGELKDKGLFLKPVVGGQYQLFSAGSKVFCETKTEDERLRPSSEFPCDAKAGEKPISLAETPKDVPSQKRPLTAKSTKDTIVFHIRSPQGILFYLGEIVRLYEDDRKIEPIVEKGRSKSRFILFFAQRRASRAASQLTVRYLGQAYSIPARGPGPVNHRTVSMQVLSLLTQLTALHRESDELPTTRAVTVVGR